MPGGWLTIRAHRDPDACSTHVVAVGRTSRRSAGMLRPAVTLRRNGMTSSGNEQRSRSPFMISSLG